MQTARGKLYRYMAPEPGLFWSHVAAAVGGVIVVLSSLFSFYFQRQINRDASAKSDERHAEITSKLDLLITNTQLTERQRSQLTQMLLRVEQSSEQALKKRYDLGYALMRVSGGNFYYIPRNVELNVDWMSTKITSIDEKSLTILLPNFVDRFNNRAYANVATIRRVPGFRFAPIATPTATMIVECVDNSPADVTLVVGFKSNQ